MADADVLVVGGGPAGLAAARAAAEGGARTLLIERDAEIGAPIRTSGASWLGDMAELGIPAALAHPVHTVRFVGPDRQVGWTYRTPVACVLDVRGVYQHLAERAIRAGAAVRLRQTATAPLLADGRVVGVAVRDDRGRTGELRATVTVDASGSPATLAVKAGLRPSIRRLGVGAELDLLAPAFDQDQAVLLVGRQTAPHGYAWAFPHGQGRVRVGVGVLRPDTELDPKALLRRLLMHPALAASLAGAQPLEYHTGVLPAESIAGARFSSAGLLAAGDSVTQASPLLGEGIRYVLRAGALAGRTAAEAVAAGDVSAAFLGRYDRAWHRQFGREMAVAYWLSRRLARYGDRNWRVVLALLGCLGAGDVAAGLHGAFTAGWWLRLVVRSPWLAAVALRTRYG